MIETIECKMIPATIMHRITGNIDVEEVKRSIDEANESMNKIIDKYGRFNLLIDLRGISFTDLAAHKTWKIWLQNRLIMKKVNYTAIVLVYSTQTKAEKELMETETLQFFFDLKKGIYWLQNRIALK